AHAPVPATDRPVAHRTPPPSAPPAPAAPASPTSPPAPMPAAPPRPDRSHTPRRTDAARSPRPLPPPADRRSAPRPPPPCRTPLPRPQPSRPRRRNMRPHGARQQGALRVDIRRRNIILVQRYFGARGPRAPAAPFPSDSNDGGHHGR